MDKAARIRWAVLLTLLATTLAAIFYPMEGGTAHNAARASPPGAKEGVRKPPSVAVTFTPELANAIWLPIEDDPFASRGWQAPPPAPVAAVVPAPTPVLSPPAPVGPPPLPFQFVGSLNDDTGQTIYLGRGDQAVIARSGEVLDGTYKVKTVSAEQVEFEYLPTGQTQTLAIPARTN